MLMRPVNKGDRLLEDPCISAEQSAVMFAKVGRSCPRVDLMADNDIPAALLMDMALENGQTALTLATEGSELTPDERRDVLRRAKSAHALSTPLLRRLKQREPPSAQ